MTVPQERSPTDTWLVSKATLTDRRDRAEMEVGFLLENSCLKVPVMVRAFQTSTGLVERTRPQSSALSRG